MEGASTQRGEQQRRKQEALARLWHEHWSGLVEQARLALDDASDAEDIASAVFEVATRKLRPGQPFNRRWLARTLNNKVRDHEKQSARRGLAYLKASVAMTASGERPDDELRLLQNLICTRLSECERVVLEETICNDTPDAEIGRKLNLNVANVRQIRSRARRKLRSHLVVAGSDLPHTRPGAHPEPGSLSPDLLKGSRISHL